MLSELTQDQLNIHYALESVFVTLVEKEKIIGAQRLLPVLRAIENGDYVCAVLEMELLEISPDIIQRVRKVFNVAKLS